MNIRISWYTLTEDLGPGKRFALWVQGCKRSCSGCIAPSLQDMSGGEDADTAEIAQKMIDSGADGITLSGGEPFLQSEALCDILERVRAVRDIGVICYTGNTFEDIKDDPLVGHIDLLIDGEYIMEKDDGRAMRGSSNQRLIFLTDRYSPGDMPQHRHSHAVFAGDSFRMIGIPSEGARQFLHMMSGDDDEKV